MGISILSLESRLHQGRISVRNRIEGIGRERREEDEMKRFAKAAISAALLSACAGSPVCAFEVAPGKIRIRIDIDVLKAKVEMLEYLTEETCTIDDELRWRLGLSLGDQFRLTVRNVPGRYGLVTIHSDYEDGPDDDDIRMRESGRQRFGEIDPFEAFAEPWTPYHGKTDSWLRLNSELGEFKVETSPAQTSIIIMAPHGGAIETNTDEIAAHFYDQLTAVYSKSAGLWYCCGYQDSLGAFDAWHITSSDISESSFPYLGELADRSYDFAVSVHGYSGLDVLVGGGGSTELKEDVRNALAGIPGFPFIVTVVTSGGYAGVHPDNIVNRYSDEGVQLELPYTARVYWKNQIAEALAELFWQKI